MLARLCTISTSHRCGNRAQSREHTLRVHRRDAKINSTPRSGVSNSNQEREALGSRMYAKTMRRCRRGREFEARAHLRWRVQCGITQNAHSVALVTGYHRLLSTKGDLQHLLPA